LSSCQSATISSFLTITDCFYISKKLKKIITAKNEKEQDDSVQTAMLFLLFHVGSLKVK